MEAVVNRIGTMDRFQVDNKKSIPVRENGNAPEAGITRPYKTMADQSNLNKGAVKQEVGECIWKAKLELNHSL